jgi:hypothetical protein
MANIFRSIRSNTLKKYLSKNFFNNYQNRVFHQEGIYKQLKSTNQRKIIQSSKVEKKSSNF